MAIVNGRKDQLTEKQTHFVKVYDGDLKKTAKKIGISYAYARNLYSRKEIKQSIQKRTEKKSGKIGRLIYDREQRQRFWTSIMTGEIENAEDGTKVTIADRLKASELLGKSEADFTEKREHSVGLTLEDKLRQIRERRESR